MVEKVPEIISELHRLRVTLEPDCQETDSPIVTAESSRVSRPPRRLMYCHPVVPN